MERKIYCSYGHAHEANWLIGHFGFKRVYEIEDATLVLFGGGEDIDPAIYGERNSTITKHFNRHRDEQEIRDFNKAKEMGIRMWGTCRGSQFLCSMSGGKLIQDVNNHAGRHGVKWYDGTESRVTSTHHQMQYPFDMDPDDYRILSWASPRRSDKYLINEETKLRGEVPFEGFVEPETVWYPKTKALVSQCHYEFDYGYGRGSEEDLEVIYRVFDMFWNDTLEAPIFVNKKEETAA